jgi:RloB-like protein
MSKSKGEKKPLSKKTLALLDQLKRKRGIRELGKRFLIVCEDGKSAPNYFEALKKHYNLSAMSVRVVGSGGSTQPIQVVTRAVELKKNAEEAESGTVPFSQVWCVIDGDYGDKIVNARAKATANSVKLAISTKCFEYWLLLHYEENDSSTLDCDALVSSLRDKHVPGYEKGTCEFHDMVTRVEDAVARAEKLRRPGIKRGELPENQNPCSEVYKLIKAIKTADSPTTA